MESGTPSSSRGARLAWLILRGACVIGLAGCALLLADHLRDRPAVCGPASACEYVRQSPYGRLLGLPLPVIGLAAFGSLLSLTLLAPRLGRAAAFLAALPASWLLALQVAGLGRLCPYCVAVDGAALVATFAAIWAPCPPPKPRIKAWAIAAGLALALPAAFATLKPATPPPLAVQAAWSAGRITVVEYTDFGCPHCRTTHGELTAALAETTKPLTHQLRPVAMKRQRAAREAAVLYPALVDAGIESHAAADVLFETVRLAGAAAQQAGRQDEQVTWEAALAPLGVTSAQVADWLQDFDTKVAALRDAARAAQVRNVPSVWVQDRIVIGAQKRERYAEALRKARLFRPAR